MKFLHTLGTVGMLGALAAMLILHTLLPPTQELAGYVTVRVAISRIAEWLLLPSLGMVLVSGLLAMAVGKYFQNAGWAWAKLAMGVVMFEGTLLAVQGPAQREARLAESAGAGEASVSDLALSLSSEWYSIWVIALLATLNIVLGIWRPKFGRKAR
ncbi:MAG: hypothetical protein AAGI11_18930 [Pseudomonadota bacterium]